MINIALNDENIMEISLDELKKYSLNSEFIQGFIEVLNNVQARIMNIRIISTLIDQLTIKQKKDILLMAFLILNKKNLDDELYSYNILTAVLLIVDFLCPVDNNCIGLLVDMILSKLVTENNNQWIDILILTHHIELFRNSLITSHIDELLNITTENDYKKIYENIPDIFCEITIRKMSKMNQTLEEYKTYKKRNNSLIGNLKSYSAHTRVHHNCSNGNRKYYFEYTDNIITIIDQLHFNHYHAKI